MKTIRSSVLALVHTVTRRSSLALALALIVCAGAATTACGGEGEKTAEVRSQQTTPPPPEPLLWVSNRDTNTAVAFNPITGARVAVVQVGHQPNSLAAPKGSGKVYVTNEAGNTVSVLSKGVVTSTITMPTPDAKPHHITPSPDGRYVYVAEFGSNKVAVIDAATDALVKEFVAHPESLPELTAAKVRTHAVGVSADGRTLYAVNTGTDTVTALDASTGAIVWGPLQVGKGPSEVAVTSNGERAYVSVRDEDLVRVIDLSTRGAPRLLDPPIAVGDQPDTLQLTPDGRTLVVALARHSRTRRPCRYGERVGEAAGDLAGDDNWPPGAFPGRTVHVCRYRGRQGQGRAGRRPRSCGHRQQDGRGHPPLRVSERWSAPRRLHGSVGPWPGGASARLGAVPTSADEGRELVKRGRRTRAGDRERGFRTGASASLGVCCPSAVLRCTAPETTVTCAFLG